MNIQVPKTISERRKRTRASEARQIEPIEVRRSRGRSSGSYEGRYWLMVGSLGETRRTVRQDGKHRAQERWFMSVPTAFLSVFQETMPCFCHALLFPFLMGRNAVFLFTAGFCKASAERRRINKPKKPNQKRRSRLCKKTIQRQT